MATISQRITLEGADDIQKALQALGDAGAKAFKQIQDAAAQPITNQAGIDKTKQALDQLSQAVAKLSPQFKQLASDTQAFGAAGASATQQVTTGLNQTTTASQSAGAGLLSAAKVFGVAAVGVAVAVSAMVSSLTKGAGDTAQQITDQANKLTITVPQWLKLKAAIDAAGGSSEQFVSSVSPLIATLNKLNLESSGQQFFTFANGAKVVVQTMTNMTPAAAAMTAELQKFGVSLKAIQTGDTVTIAQQLAATIAKMPAGAAQAAAGVKFFGDNWKQTVSVLTLASAAVKDATTAMDLAVAAARQMSPAQIKAADDARKAWEDLGSAIKAVKDQIGALFAGPSEARAKWLTDMVDQARALFQTFVSLDEEGRKGFLQGLGDSAGELLFKTLLQTSQLLAAVWTNVLVPAGNALFEVFKQIGASLGGLPAGNVIAFFLTAAIAVAGFALALQGLSLLLSPLTLLLSTVFSPFGVALLAAAAAAVVFWDQLKAGAQSVAALIPAELAQIGDSLKKLFSGDFAGFWNEFSAAAVAAFEKITAAAAQTDLGKALISTFNQLKEQLPGAIALVIKAFLSILPILDQVAAAINIVFGTNLNGVDILVMGIFAQWTGALQVVAETAIALGNIFGGPVKSAIAIAALAAAAFTARTLDWQQAIADGTAWQKLQTMATEAINSISNLLGQIAWDAVKAAGVAAWTDITNAINDAIEAIKVFIGLRPPPNPSAGSGSHAPEGPPAPGFAGGGMIGGRGTGTSDSNLAWVSRGEHIMPAAAVAQPGVLTFLEALRRSGGDLSRALDGLGRFAMGGPVGLPALATGGLSGMSHVTIQFPGMPAISGLRASSDVVAELQRSAAMAQVRSGGRKPSRYT